MENKNAQLDIQTGTTVNDKGIYIQIEKDGPYELHGASQLSLQFIVPNEKGISVDYQDGKDFPTKAVAYLCRCGHSKHKPFCDGSHKIAIQEDVDLTETATFNPSLQTAEIMEGPVLSLTDDEKFCAFARFCDNGQRVWNEVQSKSDHAVKMATNEAHLCPSGRLIVWDNKDNTPIESKQEANIGLIEDVLNKCSGPIALWGGIPVKSSDGKYYEVRNRQTLCRCGQSSNKPFCDGTHASMKFQDGLTDYRL